MVFVVDVAVFVLFYRLASTRSAGLLFVPIAWYLVFPLPFLLALYQPLLGMIRWMGG